MSLLVGKNDGGWRKLRPEMCRRGRREQHWKSTMLMTRRARPTYYLDEGGANGPKAKEGAITPREGTRRWRWRRRHDLYRQEAAMLVFD